MVPRERAQQIVALRAEGLTLAEIGRRYDLSRQRIAQIIDESGVARVPQPEIARARHAARSWQTRRRAGHVIKLWRHGHPVGAIHRETGVPWSAIRAIVAELATDSDRAARRDARRSQLEHREPRFTDRELLDGVRKVAGRLRHPPSGPEYDRLADELGLAGVRTVYGRFGGWRKALHAAGFGVEPRSIRSPRWDIASCWRALLSVADELGDPPRYRRYLELSAEREDLPSGSTLTLRLGLWREIAAALGAYARAKEAREDAAA